MWGEGIYSKLINILGFSQKLKISFRASGYDSATDIFKFQELFNTNKMYYSYFCFKMSTNF